MKYGKGLITSALLSATIGLSFAMTANAGDFGYRSCDDLWYERNAIYADKGYCFKTRRARQTFGRACFPPYGRLTNREQRRVAYIRRLEREYGCR